jgi:hypothetical protein
MHCRLQNNLLHLDILQWFLIIPSVFTSNQIQPMKKLLFLFVLLLPAGMVLSQNTEPSRLAVRSFKTYGFVEGTRLDSIDAKYAEFEWRSNSLIFNTGLYGKRKRITVTDKDGTPLLFTDPRTSLALNFFYFNGWELDRVYQTELNKVSQFILKKRD